MFFICRSTFSVPPSFKVGKQNSKKRLLKTISITFLLTDAEKQVFLHSEKLGNKLRRICRVTDYLQNQNILYCRSSQFLKIFAVKFALFIDYYFLQNEKENNFMTEERQNIVTVTVTEINKEDLGVLHIFSSELFIICRFV